MKPDLAARLLKLSSEASVTREEILDALRGLSDEEKEEVDKLLQPVTAAWAPLPGPQTLAYYSEADILFYGGSAGGGKTDLLLGTSLLFRRPVILRREFPNMRAIIERSRMLFNRQGVELPKDSYNESLHRWKFKDGRLLELGALQHEKDSLNYQGQPHDLYGFDEITEFTMYQFQFVTGWLRHLDLTRRPLGRLRAIATGNPPTNQEGQWIVGYWRPWLDERHPNPAAPCDLRWFTTLNGEDTEVDGPEPFKHNGELITPKSRTFIPASLKDNPYLEDSGYRAQLQQLPEPLRSKLLYGDFKSGIADAPTQLIPTEWIKIAQAKWKQRERPKGIPQQCGVDVARGGRDRTVLENRFGNWFDRPIEHPGSITKDGDIVATLIVQKTHSRTAVAIDVIGIGSSAYDSTKKVRKTVPMNASEGTDELDKSGMLGFKNCRSLWYWRFREALDPEHGEDIALSDHREVLPDLCAPTFRVVSGKIEVESKDDIVKRLKRSPDIGDAHVYAHAKPPRLEGEGLLDFYAEEYHKSQIAKKQEDDKWGRKST